LEEFFEQHSSEVFYERQLEIIFERQFFHWITRKALYELHDAGDLSLESQQLNETVSIKLYRHKRHRFWKRQAAEVTQLVRAFSAPPFIRALGLHGELMFDAALPSEGFMPKGKNITAYAGQTWTSTAHNLDRLFERDGVIYGAEIKNTLPYIPLKEMRTKITMCELFGIRPLFIVRMAPKSYIEEVRQHGGFTLVFQYQLYPHGSEGFASTVRERLKLPVDCPAAIAQGTIQRFARWHERNPRQPDACVFIDAPQSPFTISHLPAPPSEFFHQFTNPTLKIPLRPHPSRTHYHHPTTRNPARLSRVSTLHQ